MSIQLYFKKIIDLELDKKIKDIYAIRLFCDMRFKTKEGWTDPYPAILDTGAPVSVIPFKIWSNAEVNIITNHRIRGVIPKEECTLPVHIGKIKCVLVDKENITKEQEVVSFFITTNNVPLILGFKDLLEKFTIHFNYLQNQAYLEEIK